MKLRIAVVILFMLIFGAACAPTHTTVADALAGNVGDNVELEAVQVQGFAMRVAREAARDLVVFNACDRAGDCMQMAVGATTGDLDARLGPAELLSDGDFVKILGGELTEEEGRPVIRAGIISSMTAPEDWPAE